MANNKTPDGRKPVAYLDQDFLNSPDARAIRLPNVWLGVSVEDQPTAAARIALLLQTPAALRFVSYEPALAAVDFTCLKPAPNSVIDALRGEWAQSKRDYPTLSGLGEAKLGWLIVGGESGPGARPFDIAWARSARDQCAAAGTAFFMKQVGSNPRWTKQDISDAYWKPCPDRKGGTMAEWPEDIRIRQFPEAR